MLIQSQLATLTVAPGNWHWLAGVHCLCAVSQFVDAKAVAGGLLPIIMSIATDQVHLLVH